MSAFHIPGRFTPSPRLMKNLLTLAIISAAVTGAGLFLAPQRTWPNLLLAMYYLMSLGLGAILFIALQYISNAGWSVALRRVPESMTGVLPVAGALLLLTFFGIHALYEWSHTDVVAADPILSSKAGWLNTPFFIARAVLYFGAWWFLAHKIVRLSKHQDTNGVMDVLAKNKRYSAIFIVVFAFTFSLASMDWIMSLEPHWYSTIFGIYNFAGLFLTALAAMTIVVILMKRMGPFREILTTDHLHNLGKLIFAFSTFWMYIWFSQYLLIWYANIPEEVTYLVNREHGTWVIFTIVNVVFNWAIPFIVLLPQWTKKNEGLLLRVCVIIMIGHWVDLAWMILPPFMSAGPELFLWEVAPMVGVIVAFFYLTFRALSRGNVIPVKDPMLVESLHHS
jgi:hypothetical protein